MPKGANLLLRLKCCVWPGGCCAQQLLLWPGILDSILAHCFAWPEWVHESLVTMVAMVNPKRGELKLKDHYKQLLLSSHTQTYYSALFIFQTWTFTRTEVPLILLWTSVFFISTSLFALSSFFHICFTYLPFPRPFHKCFTLTAHMHFPWVFHTFFIHFT